MSARHFTDQMGRTVEVPKNPKRIVSLVPSQTELLFHWGLKEKVVGITKFCIHPKQEFKSTFKVGGTKDVYIDRIRELNPDLIIGNKEENDQKNLSPIMEEFPVWMSDIFNLDDSLKMMTELGKVLNVTEKAEELVSEIASGFSRLKPATKKVRVAYLIWQDPIMAAGHNTFINHLLERCGFENIFAGADYQYSRYPEITQKQLIADKVDAILLSSEPFPFGEKHIDNYKQMCKNSKVKLVDGEIFSWYGNRLLLTPNYLQETIKYFS
ncbi:MAG: ABC-type Fe3+-hydroxamate transport system substrate-binding protein [Sphingobacteriales bacterium]|jgi:ABC-type Fe3+-hydroxamate transport system substrate-binding protein